MPKYSAFRINPVKPLVTPQNWRSSKVGRRQKKNSQKKLLLRSYWVPLTFKMHIHEKNSFARQTTQYFIYIKWFWSKSSRIEKFSKSAHCPQLSFKKCPLLSKHTRIPNFFCSPNDAIITSKFFDHSAHLNLKFEICTKNGEKNLSKILDVKF